MVVPILAAVYLVACNHPGADRSADDGPPPAATPADAASPPGTTPADAATSPDSTLPDGGDRSASTTPTPWPPPEQRDPDPIVQAAADRLAAGAPAEAVAAMDAWLEAHPDDPDALRVRGVAKERLDPPDPVGAEADLRRAIQLDGDFVGARLALCDLLIPQKRCVDALPHLDWLVDRFPELADSWANRSFCRLSTHDWEGGVADAERACQLGHPRSCDMLPRLRIRLDHERARAATDASAAASSNPRSGDGADGGSDSAPGTR